MYCLSCFNCKIEYQFKGLFASRKLKKFGKACQKCGGYLSFAPLLRYEFTPPPECKKIKVDVKEIEV